MWVCPKCQSVLTTETSSWACSNNHRFDIAKEGYVNLLLANQKRTKEPGDNKEMINARRLFLEQNHYLPLADKLSSLIQGHFTKSQDITLYDIGCGEGYYLNHIHQSLKEQGLSLSSGGSDISKNAIQKAAKKYKECKFAVASNANLPLASNEVDAFLQVFAPSNSNEVSRVISDDGIWLQVSPGAEHLKEMKEQIYSTPEEHSVSSLDIPDFMLQHQEILAYKVNLSRLEDRRHLLMMTPFYWSSKQDKIDIIVKALRSITISFHIKVFSKNIAV
jgi:23S rRNA (guanine745-N1)-methyltransferase